MADRRDRRREKRRGTKSKKQTVEIPGPVEVPDQVIEAMRKNISKPPTLPPPAVPGFQVAEGEFPCPINSGHHGFTNAKMLRKHLVIDHRLPRSDVVNAIAKSRELQRRY